MHNFISYVVREALNFLQENGYWYVSVLLCRYSIVVVHDFAKVEARVQIPLLAPLSKCGYVRLDHVIRQIQ